MSDTSSGFPRRPGAPRDSHAPLSALAEGRVFGGRYRVVRHIATGGMGSVYEVVHLETERRRALKVMHPHLFQSDEMRERFQREARIAAQVESEFIVDVSDAGVDEATGTPFLVMELLHGEELGRLLSRTGPMSPAEVMGCLHQVGRALDRTHSRNIVHRDLKPENLFLTHREDGSPRIKILDFGVAKLVAEGATGAGGTRSLGTPLYMAPEQFRTGSRILPAADIYALGMMAFTLLVGEPYWAPEASEAGDVIAFAMTAVEGPKEPAVRRAAARGVALPAAFDGWFARATAVNPAQRFRSASEAVRALGEALGVNPGTGTLVLPGGRAVTDTGGASGARGAGGLAAGPGGAGGPGAAPGAALRGMAAGPGGASRGLSRASTLTGAAVAPVSERRTWRRLPLAWAAGVGAAGILAVVVWLGMGGSGGDEGAGSGAASGGAGRPALEAGVMPEPSAIPEAGAALGERAAEGPARSGVAGAPGTAASGAEAGSGTDAGPGPRTATDEGAPAKPAASSPSKPGATPAAKPGATPAAKPGAGKPAPKPPAKPKSTAAASSGAAPGSAPTSLIGRD